MAPTYVLKFSLECFNIEERETMLRYFEGMITAGEACECLGWGSEEWCLAMATVFDVGVKDEQPEAELRRA